jgi:hypothetical protein
MTIRGKVIPLYGKRKARCLIAIRWPAKSREYLDDDASAVAAVFA